MTFTFARYRFRQGSISKLQLAGTLFMHSVVMIHNWTTYKPGGCILALCADMKDTILRYITSTSPYPPHPHRRPPRLRVDGSKAEAAEADGPT